MNDLISREAAIDAILHYELNPPYYMNGWAKRLILAIKKDLKDDIEKIPSTQQWIPVSERLPEHEQQVVIKTKIGVTEVMMFCNYDAVYFCRFGIDESVDWYVPNEVEVWMPLPEPYKAEGEKIDE